MKSYFPRNHALPIATATGKDWKLNPDVLIKVNLENTRNKSQDISHESHNHHHGSNSRPRSTLSIKSTFLNPTDSFSHENREEILFDYESDCIVCHEYILRFTQHIRESHQRHEYQEMDREDLSPPDEAAEIYADDEERINVEEGGKEVQIHASSSSMNFELNTDEHNSSQQSGPESEENEIKTETISDSDSDYEPDYCETNEALPHQGNSTIELEPKSIVEKTKTLVCEICDKKFRRQSNFTKHLRLHGMRNEKSAKESKVKNRCHSCPECNQSYGTVSGLRNHYRRTHKKLLNHDLTPGIAVNENDRKYSCRFCDKSYFNLKDLWEHNHTKHKGMAYECKFCKLKFTRHYERKAHINLAHGQEIAITCKTCGKVFATNFKLEEHVRTHTRDSPFMCEICSKCFSLRGSLNRHYRIHQEESGEWVRPWVCDICDARFTRKAHLADHSSKHTNYCSLMCDDVTNVENCSKPISKFKLK